MNTLLFAPSPAITTIELYFYAHLTASGIFKGISNFLLSPAHFFLEALRPPYPPLYLWDRNKKISYHGDILQLNQVVVDH
jgi:hypothetical protein